LPVLDAWLEMSEIQTGCIVRFRFQIDVADAENALYGDDTETE
jgi:hypothetical protein